MKNILLLSLCLATVIGASSQYAVPPYKQNKTLPAFELQQANNTIFSSTKLKKTVPTVIMFFSPGCDHCIDQFESMIKRMNDLKNYQIVMATYQPLEELAEFNARYKISKYPNIVTGRDANYFLPPFFQISNFPYLAFYGKNGQLTGAFQGNMSVDDMIKKLK
jgi:thioredoxin-related protein